MDELLKMLKTQGGQGEVIATWEMLLAMGLAIACLATISLCYRLTHKGSDYSQSFVQTLILTGMVTTLIMLVIGSGDANGSGRTDLADGIFVLTWRFSEGTEPGCLDAADFNDDGRTDIADAIKLFTWQFLEGTPAADPFPDCGLDSAEADDLGCLETSSDCE